MTKEFIELRQAVQDHGTTLGAMDDLLDLFAAQIEDTAARTTALMVVLRAVVLNSPARAEIAATVERIAAQSSIQPKVLLAADKSSFLRAKEHMEWMVAPGQPPDDSPTPQEK